MATPAVVLPGAAGPYDDPKAWALPILVVATALARLLEARDVRILPPPAPDRASRALWFLAVASLAWWVVTTIGSVAPALSLFGNFGRGMGLFATGAAIGLFFLVQSACRSRGAPRALVDAALLGSVPVCLLGLGQALGWDLLPIAWDPSVADMSVRSTLGQHIVLGSYLALLVPLTAVRLETAVRAWRSGPPWPASAPRVRPAVLIGAVWALGALAIMGLGARWTPLWWALVPWGVAGAAAVATTAPPPDDEAPSAVAPALLSLLLVAQVAVLLLSRARGPLLGVFVGIAIAGFVLLVRRRAWRTVGAGALAAALFLAAIALLNVPGSPLRGVAQLPLFARLADLTNVQHGSPGWFRLHAWKGVVDGWAAQLRGEAIIPGTSPVLRSFLGYGLETELIALDPMAQRALSHPGTERAGWTAYYLVDRAHNTLLEHLVTGGLVGAALWLAVVATVLIASAARVRESVSDDEVSLRLGGLGALIAHLAEGQVGIVLAVPLALFWMTAGWATAPWPAGDAPPSSEARARPRWWTAAIVVAALALVTSTWGMTRWLLASMAYARGGAAALSGNAADALPHFERARTLMPWVPLTVEAVVQTRSQLAAGEPDPARRAQLLREAEAAIIDLRRHALPGAADWALLAHLSIAQARLGDRARLPVSLDAFARAVALSPRNPELLAQWGLALLNGGDPVRAREAGVRALAAAGGRGSWLGWTVVALAAREVGNRLEERHASEMARKQAPPAARRSLDSLLR